MSRGLVVEFAGLPGAGKSSLADRLPAALSKRGIAAGSAATDIGPQVATARRLARKLALVTGHGVASPTRSLRLGRLAVATQPGAVDAAARMVQWEVTQRLLLRAREAGGVQLFDEGVLQALWSWALRGDVTPMLARLADGSVRWSAPDLVVVVDIAPELARERLRARRSQHSRTQLLDPDEQLDELRRGRDRLTDLLAWLPSTAPGGCETTRVDGGLATPEVAVELIANQVGRLGR